MSPTTSPTIDVVIVGAGAAGATLAAKLSEGGKRVVILEAGPPWRLKDLVSSEIWARRLRWAGPPATSGGKDPMNLQLNSGWGNGGSALHHTGLWWRLREDDFDLRSKHDVGLDWPFAYDELRSWYDLLQREVGVSGDAEAERSRPPGEAYPLGPLPTFASDDLLAEGFRAMGRHVHPAPQAVLSASYNGRRPCLAGSWCVAGCPIGALGNPLVTYLPQAIARGARVLSYSRVTRVLSTGSRATGVEYVDERGTLHTVRAKTVVLAAYAIENPRLLLNSISDEHPAGLGNRFDQVGRYLGGHLLASGHGFVDGEAETGFGTNQSGRVASTDTYAKDAARGFPGSYYTTTAGAFKPNGYLGLANQRTDLFGPDLVRFLRRGSRHLLAATVFGSPVQLAGNRVTVDPERRDGQGMALAHVEHSFAPQDLLMHEAMRKEARDVLEASGARDVQVSPQAIMVHIFGGAVMGDDPRRSVTNAYGAVHGVRNLFVAGSNLFPMGGAVNPTFTLQALAARTAARMLEDWAELT